MLTLEQIIQNEKMVIHTKTGKQAEALLKSMREKKLNRLEAILSRELIRLLPPSICYHPATGTFSTMEECLEKGYTVVPFSDVDDVTTLDENKAETLDDVIRDKKTVIWADTQETAKELLLLFHEKGLCWDGGKSYLQEDFWMIYKRETCYSPSGGTFSSRSYYEGKEFRIVKADTFLNNEQTICLNDGIAEEQAICVDDIIQDEFTVIHASTQQQADELSKLFHEKGLRWKIGKTYLEKNVWSVHEAETCYKPAIGMYGSRRCFEGKSHRIIKAEEVLQREEKKKQPVTLDDVIADKKMVIHVPQKKQAVELMKRFHEKGLRWVLGQTYLERDNWSTYEEKTCYKPSEGQYAPLSYCETEGLRIVKVEDLLNENLENEPVTLEEIIADGRTVIHAPTKEKAKKLMQLFHEKGLRWKSGESYLLDDRWATCTHETCYDPSNGTFCSKEYWKKRRYSIVEVDVLLGDKQAGKQLVATEDILEDTNASIHTPTEEEAEILIKEWGHSACSANVELEDIIIVANMAIHTPTEEEALRLMEELDKKGCIWASGNSYLERKIWDRFGPLTCFFPSQGTYGSLSYAEHYQHTIFTIDKIAGFPELKHCEYEEALKQLTSGLDEEKMAHGRKLEEAIEKARKFDEMKTEMERMMQNYC